MAAKLEGKVAVVTGAGRGVGRAVAKLMAREGAKVVVADNGSSVDGTGTSAEPADLVVEAIVKDGGTALGVACDVSDWSAAEQLIALPIETWGKLDILVNVAGNFRADTITDCTPANLEALLRVHMFGTMATSHFAALHWKERRDYGRLINFTSDSGMSGVPDTFTYAGAKAGIVGLTRAAANALVNYRVTANALTQASHTRMGDDYRGDLSQEQLDKHGHYPHETPEAERSPDTVAPLVVFLASPQAADISGRIFGSYGYRYLLWSEPDHERTLWSDGPWDLDRLFEEFPRTLGKDLALSDLPFPLESLDQKVPVAVTKSLMK